MINTKEICDNVNAQLEFLPRAMEGVREKILWGPT